MTRFRRSYPSDLKTEAVKLVIEQADFVTGAARSTGLNDNLIGY